MEGTNSSSSLTVKKRTVLEQQYFDAAMKRMEEQRIKPQICWGKMFKGQPFISEPQVIKFLDFEVGNTYTIVFSLTNVSLTFNSFTILPFPDDVANFFDIEYVQKKSATKQTFPGDAPGTMSAGTSCKLKITFKPKLETPLETKINFMAQTGPFSIPCVCQPKKVEISIHSKTARESEFYFLDKKESGEATTEAEITTESAMTARSDTAASSVRGEKEETDPSESVFSAADNYHVLEFGKIVIGERKTLEFQIENSGSYETAFKISGKAINVNMIRKSSQTEEINAKKFLKFNKTADFVEAHNMTTVSISFCPTCVQNYSSWFKMEFNDKFTSPKWFKLRGEGIDVPIFLKRELIDFRCMFFLSLYREELYLYNRGKTAMKFSLSPPPELKNCLEFVPNVGFIQGKDDENSPPQTFLVKLKFKPQKELAESCTKFMITNLESHFRSKGKNSKSQISDLSSLNENEKNELLNRVGKNLFEIPIGITIPDQVFPVGFKIRGNFSTSNLECVPNLLKFPKVVIGEVVTLPLNITNHASLPQSIGFVDQHPVLSVTPNSGFFYEKKKENDQNNTKKTAETLKNVENSQTITTNVENNNEKKEEQSEKPKEETKKVEEEELEEEIDTGFPSGPLLPGETRTVQISFGPKAEMLYNLKLNLVNERNENFVISIQGEGVAAPLEFQPSNYVQLETCGKSGDFVTFGNSSREEKSQISSLKLISKDKTSEQRFFFDVPENSGLEIEPKFGTLKQNQSQNIKIFFKTPKTDIIDIPKKVLVPIVVTEDPKAKTAKPAAPANAKGGKAEPEPPKEPQFEEKIVIEKKDFYEGWESSLDENNESWSRHKNFSVPCYIQGFSEGAIFLEVSVTVIKNKLVISENPPQVVKAQIPPQQAAPQPQAQPAAAQQQQKAPEKAATKPPPPQEVQKKEEIDQIQKIEQPTKDQPAEAFPGLEEVHVFDFEDVSINQVKKKSFFITNASKTSSTKLQFCSQPQEAKEFTIVPSSNSDIENETQNNSGKATSSYEKEKNNEKKILEMLERNNRMPQSFNILIAPQETKKFDIFFITDKLSSWNTFFKLGASSELDSTFNLSITHKTAKKIVKNELFNDCKMFLKATSRDPNIVVYYNRNSKLQQGKPGNDPKKPAAAPATQKPGATTTANPTSESIEIIPEEIIDQPIYHIFMGDAVINGSPQDCTKTFALLNKSLGNFKVPFTIENIFQYPMRKNGTPAFSLSKCEGICLPFVGNENACPITASFATDWEFSSYKSLYVVRYGGEVHVKYLLLTASAYEQGGYHIFDPKSERETNFPSKLKNWVGEDIVSSIDKQANTLSLQIKRREEDSSSQAASTKDAKSNATAAIVQKPSKTLFYTFEKAKKKELKKVSLVLGCTNPTPGSDFVNGKAKLKVDYVIDPLKPEETKKGFKILLSNPNDMKGSIEPGSTKIIEIGFEPTDDSSEISKFIQNVDDWVSCNVNITLLDPLKQQKIQMVLKGQIICG